MCYASISSKCRGCDGVDVESTEEEEEEDEEAAVPVHQKNKGNGTRGSESDNDGEDKEEDEDEEEEEEEGEEGAARPKASTKKRSRVCSQSERVLMIHVAVLRRKRSRHLWFGEIGSRSDLCLDGTKNFIDCLIAY